MKTITSIVAILIIFSNNFLTAQDKSFKIKKKSYVSKSKIKPKTVVTSSKSNVSIKKDTVNFGKLKIKTFDLKSQAYYPYGDEALFIFIAQNLKYSANDVDKKVDGKVLIRFDVDVDSTIKEVRLIKNPCIDCGNELIKMFENFRFAPALTNNGTPMRSNVMMEIPVWAHQ